MEKAAWTFAKRTPSKDRGFAVQMPVLCGSLLALALLSLAFSFSLPKEKSEPEDLRVRKAAVAGTFYPGDKATLEKYVDNLLRQAQPPKITDPIRAIMAPHAGYIFSGSVAASAYKELQGRNIRTVILIGSAHRHYLDGIAVYAKGNFETPLGWVPVDEEKSKKLLQASPKIMDRPDIHEDDHVLEVQLPFLQRTLKDFKIVPILFGTDDPALPGILAGALKNIIDDRTLIVASTDMSHYPSYEDAIASDRETLQAIETGEAPTLNTTLGRLARKGVPNTETFLCSTGGVQTVLTLNKDFLPTKPVFLKYANSGDATGEKSRVVGYGAIAFVASSDNGSPTATLPSKETRNAPDEKMLTSQEGKELLRIARSTVESYVRTGKIPAYKPSLPGIDRNLGAFVTLKENGELRGCIGRFEPSEPLYKIVQQMAASAATQDPRFSPVKATELDQLSYEVSVLSPLRKIKNADEIQLGKHGVTVSRGFNHGVFLPQVATETGWNKVRFLSELCTQKAGLPANCWEDPSVNFSVFTAEVFPEKKEPESRR